jgi:SAM-dependent methyltransferase
MVTALRSYPTSVWPDGSARVPDEPWIHEPLDTFGTSYDAVDAHGWYRNLDPTVAQILAALQDGDILIDYSGGTGILDRRLLRAVRRPVGILIADSSPKFLRVAVEDLASDERVAFRLLPFLKTERRLRTLDEVLGPELLARGADLLASTNAIHLYNDLPPTLQGWRRSLRHGARVFVSSGNLRNPNARDGEWIIDETVGAINEIAARLVQTEPLFEEYREVLADPGRMVGYTALREKVFVPVRPLDFYTDTFQSCGFDVLSVFDMTIQARVSEWGHLLTTYHEGVLGWVGGCEKVDGRAPTEKALRDRLFLIRHSLERLFKHEETFDCCWTYITCQSRGDA